MEPQVRTEASDGLDPALMSNPFVAGIIDVKGRDAETPETVESRIRDTLRSCAPDKLWLSADCGFSQTARPLAVEKMRSLVAGTQVVREALAAG